MNHSKNYTSTEELMARLLSLFITLAFFSVYILTKGQIAIVDWTILITHLGIFWVVYEFIGYGFFVILHQFASNKTTTLSSAINLAQEPKKSLIQDDNTVSKIVKP